MLQAVIGDPRALPRAARSQKMNPPQPSGGNNMKISRRHAGPLSVLGLVAIGVLGAKAAQEMSADEEAVAKRVEAFRSAQFAADAGSARWS